MYKILIIEDDEVIANSLKSHFNKWGFEAENIKEFQDIDKQVLHINPHIILLDIMLPFLNGFHWCNEIRKFTKIPIIFISSASDNMNIVMAMNMGGDDFIAKPFDLNVLTAKVQALIRRTYAFNSGSNIIEHDGVILNLNDTVVTYKEKKIELTKNEFKILQLLMENNGKIMSRDKIMEHLWDSDSFIDDNTLTVNITRLRKKLEEIGVLNYVKTKKGLGYVIN